MDQNPYETMYRMRGPKYLGHQEKFKQFLFEQRRKDAVYPSHYPQWLVQEFLYAKYLQNDFAVDHEGRW